MERIGSQNKDVFIEQGTLMATMLEREIRQYFGGITPELNVLDFGAGVGRALLPLAVSHKANWHACDVDATAIEYLAAALPDLDSRCTSYEPPLPYEDGQFDCVYSISIWTHLPLGLQLPWLKEMRRVLRTDGLALISTSGPYVMSIRSDRGDVGWESLTADDLEREGIIFRPYPRQGLPGVTGCYGLTAHHPEWVRRVWGQVLTHLIVHERAVVGTQDLHVMTKL